MQTSDKPLRLILNHKKFSIMKEPDLNFKFYHSSRIFSNLYVDNQENSSRNRKFGTEASNFTVFKLDQIKHFLGQVPLKIDIEYFNRNK